MTIPSHSQDYYKIKISKNRVKFVLEDYSKEIYEIDSVARLSSGSIYYLSSAEKMMTMEILQKDQLIKLVETFDGKPKDESFDQINLNTVAINRSAFR